MYTNTIQKVSYYMYCSSPVRVLPLTKQFPTTLLCCSSSPSLNPSPLFLFLSLYLLSQFLVFLPISKDILLYLVTRPDMPLQCIFWKPVETSNDNHSLSNKYRLSLICVSGDDIFQLTALRDPDSSPPRYKSTINELSIVMLQIQIWIIIVCNLGQSHRI